MVGPLAGGDPARYAGLAGALAVSVGLLCLLSRMARLGFVADPLSRPILVGYLAGVALIMIVGQLGKLTGVPVHGDTFFGQLASFLTHMSAVQAATAVFAAVVLVFLFALRRWWPAAPAALLAVLLATGAVTVFGLESRGIKVIGDVPSGIPIPALPPLDDVVGLVVPALGVLLVGYTDNILTARSFADRVSGDGASGSARHPDANQELVALGVANVGSGLFHGFPVSSSGSRTALADAAGGRSQLYSLVTLILVLATLLFLGPVVGQFPMAALGAIVVYAAVRLIDIAGFRRLAAFRRSELALALGALTGVLVFDILVGVVVAVGLSVAEMLARVARPHDAIQGFVPGLAGMHDVDDYPQATTIPGLVVYRYDSPLFFANAENFRRRALAAVEVQRDPTRWFVLNMEANVEVDITALDAVEALRRELEARQIELALARVKQDLLDQLQSFGLAAAVGADRIFPTLPTAVTAYQEWRDG
jgi:SulP family sulfate permease